MKAQRKICIVTGTRAEWGLLSRLACRIQQDQDLKLQIIAANMHLMEEYGYTYQEIEQDGFRIDYKVPMEVEGDDATATVKSMALGMSGFADAYRALCPDLIVILGDRYEMLVAASAALIYKIPIAHLYGGETTEGAYDDAIRHAITKMSHLHFTSTEVYRQRVVQLGEDPERVFYVGAMGVENIKKVSLIAKEELEKELDFKLNKQTILVTYHPVTLAEMSVEEQINNCLVALEKMKGLRIIFTLPNSDTGGKIIIDRISSFVDKLGGRACLYPSLGMRRYLSVLPHVGAVVGNSSSGLVEVPSMGIPTLNIGDRQCGRISPASVVNCASDSVSIIEGLEKVLTQEMQDCARTVINPYDKENTVENIFRQLKLYPLEHIIQKQFYNLGK